MIIQHKSSQLKHTQRRRGGDNIPGRIYSSRISHQNYNLEIKLWVQKKLLSIRHPQSDRLHELDGIECGDRVQVVWHKAHGFSWEQVVTAFPQTGVMVLKQEPKIRFSIMKNV